MSAQTIEHRATLAERREVLRQNYAGLREAGHKLGQKGAIRWDKERHTFIAAHYTPPARLAQAVKQFLILQSQIQHQARLLLELEFAIDREETKAKSSTV